MKQTAVNYLFQELWQAPKDKWMWQIILKQALEVEKQQIEDAFDVGLWDGFDLEYIESTTDYKCGQKYYTETYGKDA